MSRWRVAYDEKLRCWLAYRYTSVVGELTKGWAFHRWRDAYDYAQSNGRNKYKP